MSNPAFRTRTRTRTPRTRSRTQHPLVASGFTLVEVLVAAMLLIVAAAGVAQLLALGLRATQSGRETTSTGTLASQKIEQLRSLTWTYDAAGAPHSDTYTDLSRDPPAPGGRGLDLSPSGTLDRDVAGYVDYLDARGRWIGAGPDPPPGAIFVRRWAIQTLDDDPQDSRVLIVRAAVVTEDRAAIGAGVPRPQLPRDTVLVSLETRQRGVSW